MNEYGDIPGYTLVKRIGLGGMSTVYEAIDSAGEHVALKLLHPAIATDPQSRARLRREVSMLQRVQGPYVASLLDAETEDDDVFLVTELVDGPTLEADVKTNGVYAGDELIDLGNELATALNSIHAVGVLHRDLKPSNVMISPRGVVLIDFGIAQLGDDIRMTQEGSLAHTPGYADPRVIRGMSPDEVADWWSLAAVMLFATTGRPPFGRGTNEAIMHRVLEGQPDISGLDDTIANVFRAALHPVEESRISFTELLAALASPPTGVVEPYQPEPTLILPQTHRPPSYPQHSAQPPAYPAQLPAYPAQLPAYPAQLPAYPAQLPAYPEQPPAYPAQPPAYPAQPSGYPEQYVPSADQHVPAWLAAPPRFRLILAITGVALAVAAPALFDWVVGALIALVFIFDIVGNTRTELNRRRLRHGGPYKGETAYSITRLPWAIAVAAVRTGFAVGLSFFFVFGSALAFGRISPITEPVVTTIGLTYVALLLTWLIFGTRQMRDGAKITLRAIAPTRAYRIFWTVIALILVVTSMFVVSGTTTVNIDVLGFNPFA